MKTAAIKFTIRLDEEQVPEKIEWEATDAAEKEVKECKSVMISLWDPNEKNTLRIDLWTKEMQVDEMKSHYIQTLVTMAETFEKATGNQLAVPEMKRFCEEFIKKSDEAEAQDK